MNPEFRRNLWLELTPRRMALAAGLLGLIFFAASLSGGIGWPATWLGITNCWVAALYLSPTQHENQPGPTIEAASRIRVRVWERGAGVTPACGSGACAVLAAAVRRKLLPRPEAEIRLDGGSLHVALRDGRLWMTGPVAESFRGSLELDGANGPTP